VATDDLTHPVTDGMPGYPGDPPVEGADDASARVVAEPGA
jgi:kynurenine formamidase